MERKILVVDDEPKIVRLVQGYIEQAGFRVITAFDGNGCLQAFRRHNPDLIVLDLMIPAPDGIEVTREIRKESEVPIIMLTARGEESDKLVGLELGADDYVAKPFSPKELVARIRAVLRRAPAAERDASTAIGAPAGTPNAPRGDEQPVVAGGLTLDPVQRKVRCDGAEVELTSYQFDLLAVLVRNPGRVFTRMQLVERLQGHAYEGYERTVDAHMKNIRRALEDDAKQPRFIETVRGVGYRFLAQGG